MILEFKLIREPSADLVGQIAELSPENPFSTVEYVRVRERFRVKACALVLEGASGIVAGCLGFLSEGRVNSRLEITSLPVLPDKDIFWNGLFDACRAMGVTVLGVNTFASTETTIRRADRRTATKHRSEYRLDLTVDDLWVSTNRRHHRLIKRARSFGLELSRSTERAARDRHVELANMSLARRSSRGEAIDYRISIDDVDAFVECGAGEIIRAVREGEIFSSLLVARGRTGAYAQSSGTSDAGREIGSSHFLFYETACLLRSQGLTVFNLGGADEHSIGLQEFKLGLGAARIDLESAEFYTGGSLKKFATRAAALLKGWPFPTGI